MKILFISDIHGDAQNLNKLNTNYYDNIVILGDLFNGFTLNENIKVKDFIVNNRDKIVCVKGNCDSDYDFINLGLPCNKDYICIKDNNLNIYCTHGHRYNYRNLSYLGSSGIIIYGHEHVPSINVFNDVIYICVGSISKPRYGSDYSYCVYEDGNFTIYSITGEIVDFITTKKHFV